MRYQFLIICLFLSGPIQAQSAIAGLGHYLIGKTTLDTLNRTDLIEDEQPYVKGTLTLPCTHVRVFTSATAAIGGLTVTGLVLYFHDNTLFKIVCDYSDVVKNYFVAKHGQGIPKTPKKYRLCSQDKDKFTLMWGEAWDSGDRVALVVHTKGYTADCALTESATLSITSRRVLSLSSECDLHPTDPFTEEYFNDRGR